MKRGEEASGLAAAEVVGVPWGAGGGDWDHAAAWYGLLLKSLVGVKSEERRLASWGLVSMSWSCRVVVGCRGDWPSG